jgi:hypothetical protein
VFLFSGGGLPVKHGVDPGFGYHGLFSVWVSRIFYSLES